MDCASIKAQLDGIHFLEKLTHDLVRLGIGNTTSKTAQQLAEQARQLGNAYLPGAQAALLNYTRLFADEIGEFDRSTAKREAIYSESLDQLGRLHALIRQGRVGPLIAELPKEALPRVEAALSQLPEKAIDQLLEHVQALKAKL